MVNWSAVFESFWLYGVERAGFYSVQVSGSSVLSVFHQLITQCSYRVIV